MGLWDWLLVAHVSFLLIFHRKLVSRVNIVLCWGLPGPAPPAAQAGRGARELQAGHRHRDGAAR